ncbi:hypothetical protein [Cerasicoccus frondis]|uniref:hypothetical protein n=1 Tax=Cerasicoccus frondis TaxID=490090 RepID=UPI0028529D2A|nr:hypothetical protein [Cerasicoccus frondis]
MKTIIPPITATLLFLLIIAMSHFARPIADSIEHGYLVNWPLRFFHLDQLVSPLVKNSSMIVAMGYHYCAGIATASFLPMLVSASLARSANKNFLVTVAFLLPLVFLMSGQNVAASLLIIYIICTLPLLAIVYYGAYGVRLCIMKMMTGGIRQKAQAPDATQ